ncbi:MAG: hypothetical protein V1837_02510 [Candidatus Woesearchaeota archaeon]
MAASKLEQRIVGLFVDVKSAFSILQIAKMMNTSYPHVYNAVQGLIEQGILSKLVVGNVHLCQLNLDNDLTISLLSLLALQKREPLIRKHKSVHQFLASLKHSNLRFSVDFSFFLKGEYYLVVHDAHECKWIQQSFGTAKCLDLASGLDLLALHHTEATVLLGFERYYQALFSIFDRLQGPLEFKHE